MPVQFGSAAMIVIKKKSTQNWIIDRLILTKGSEKLKTMAKFHAQRIHSLSAITIYLNVISETGKQGNSIRSHSWWWYHRNNYTIYDYVIFLHCKLMKLPLGINCKQIFPSREHSLFTLLQSITFKKCNTKFYYIVRTFKSLLYSTALLFSFTSFYNSYIFYVALKTKLISIFVFGLQLFYNHLLFVIFY